MGYIICFVAYDVEFSDQFGEWWDALSAGEQESVAFSVRLLEEEGVNLRRPQADSVKGSKYPNCANFAAKPRAVLTAFCMPSTLAALRFS